MAERVFGGWDCDHCGTLHETQVGAEAHEALHDRFGATNMTPLGVVVLNRLRLAHAQAERIARGFKVGEIIFLIRDLHASRLLSDLEVRTLLDEHNRLKH